jgi:hypothetical protein
MHSGLLSVDFVDADIVVAIYFVSWGLPMHAIRLVLVVGSPTTHVLETVLANKQYIDIVFC